MTMPGEDTPKPMPTPKRGFVIGAVAALIIAASLIGTGLWQQTEYKWQAEYQASKNARYTNEEIRNRCVPLPPVDEANCTIQARREQRGYQRDEQDLYAQKTMAFWTFLMGSAALIGMILSSVGVFLVWTTFRETRRAADAGDTMAKEAKAATEAALRSAKVAEQALVGVERPFVVMTPIRSNEHYVAYTFSNYGRTPAVIMHTDVRYLAITPLDGPEPIRANVLQAALTPGWNVVPPGGEASGEEIVRAGTPIVEGAERADMWLLHGYVMYRALTGEIFVSGFGIYKKDKGAWEALRGSHFNYDERLEKGGPRKRQAPTITVTAHKPDK